MSLHLSVPVPSLRGLASRIAGDLRARRVVRAIRIEPSELAPDLRRDIGLEGGRFAPPRDPWRD